MIGQDVLDRAMDLYNVKWMRPLDCLVLRFEEVKQSRSLPLDPLASDEMLCFGGVSLSLLVYCVCESPVCHDATDFAAFTGFPSEVWIVLAQLLEEEKE